MKYLTKLFLVLSVSVLSACAAQVEKMPDKLVLKETSFSNLPNWQDSDAKDNALEAFSRSCKVMMRRDADAEFGDMPEFGRISDWAEPCRAIENVNSYSASDVKKYFETYFTPYVAMNNHDETGLITGYYEAEIRGSLSPSKKYPYPIYGVKKGQKSPSYSRAEIESGALRGKGYEIAYTDDPVKLFFMQIQGSGKLILDDGREIGIGYAGQNGHKYHAIGKTLLEMEELPKGGVSAPVIMQWLYNNPDRMQQVMNQNPSYVFFEVNNKKDPVGSQGVGLIKERAIAVDRKYIPLGTPIWLVTRLPETPSGSGSDYSRLLIAQDTGGAIKSPIRGDIFFGRGDEAMQKAGYMKSEGHFYLLLPRSVSSRPLLASNM